MAKIDCHEKVADSLYNQYGPARDHFYIGRTNAKDLKFNLKKKSYYSEIKDLPRRTAPILFDGKHRPKVYFDPEEYAERVRKVAN